MSKLIDLTGLSRFLDNCKQLFMLKSERLWNKPQSTFMSTRLGNSKDIFAIHENGNVYITGFGGYNGEISNSTPINTILTGANKMRVLTQQEYDSLEIKDQNTLYFIK